MSRVNRFAFIILLFSNSSFAALQGNFWVPSRYASTMPQLEQGVAAAEATKKCQKAISGTISEERSTLASPIFKLICKDQTGMTYPLLYDGQSGALTDLDAQIKKQNPQLTQTDSHSDNSRNWMRCANEFQARTSKMKGVKVVDEYNHEPNVVKNGLAKFLIDFDTAGPYGLVTKQRATCEVDSVAESVFLVISKR